MNDRFPINVFGDRDPSREKSYLFVIEQIKQLVTSCLSLKNIPLHLESLRCFAGRQDKRRAHPGVGKLTERVDPPGRSQPRRDAPELIADIVGGVALFAMVFGVLMMPGVSQ